MKTYLYRCFDRGGQLLYVGITDDWEKRRRKHAREKHWWPDVAQTVTMAFESREAALWAEWAVITTCHPVYNKAANVPATGAVPAPAAASIPAEAAPVGFWGIVWETLARIWYHEFAWPPEQVRPKVATTVPKPLGWTPPRPRVPAPRPVRWSGQWPPPKLA